MDMIYRQFGRTGIEVSLIGLGTVKFGRTTGVKYPQPFELPDDRQARALLDEAKHLGINLLDTAPAYGNAEVRLGELLKADRSDWRVCTKVGEAFDGDRSTYDFSETHTRMSVERSLKRLGGECLDIVLIHSDGRDREILEQHGTLEVLKSLQREGRINAVGMSVKSAEGLISSIDAGADVVMATLSTDYLEEREAIAAAGDKGVGVLVKKALASGHQTPASLSFVAAQPGVTSIVIGTLNADHLRQNCRFAV